MFYVEQRKGGRDTDIHRLREFMRQEQIYIYRHTGQKNYYKIFSVEEQRKKMSSPA